MRKPELVLTAALLAAAASGCSKPTEVTPSVTSVPDHLVPVVCPTNLPWEGAFQNQRSITEPVVVFALMKKPAPRTPSGIGPECWAVVKGK